MPKTIMDWKKEQLNKYFERREHVYEAEEQFIIVFDAPFKEINLEIEKSELTNYQSVVSKIVEISSNEAAHSRLNDVIYKELLEKMNEYVRGTNYDFLQNKNRIPANQNTKPRKLLKIA